MKQFVMDTLLKMVGKEEEYKIRIYGLTWVDKGVLDLNDLQEIQNAIKKYEDGKSAETEQIIDTPKKRSLQL